MTQLVLRPRRFLSSRPSRSNARIAAICRAPRRTRSLEAVGDKVKLQTLIDAADKDGPRIKPGVRFGLGST